MEIKTEEIDSTGVLLPTDSDTAPVLAKRRPIPRKGHRKTRAGCLVCKKRKTKCDESKPNCGACVRLSLPCCYATPTPAASAAKEHRPRVVVRPLKAEESTFTLSDLTFFQYFLCTSYPTLPIGRTDVWQQVGQMVHHYDFLAHATLGLGASNLAMANGQGQIEDGLDHRVKSISLMKKHLKRGSHSGADSDAVLAATMCLAYQSGYMLDGLVDYLSFLRGSYIVISSFIPNLQDSLFQNLAQDVYSDGAHHLLPLEIPDSTIDQLVTERFQLSLDSLAPLCGRDVESRYLAALRRAAAFSLSQSPDSWREHSYLWMNTGQMNNDQFASFVDPENYSSRLLIMHFAFLEFVMSWKTIAGVKRKHFAHPRVLNWALRQHVQANWVQQVQDELPEGYKVYGQGLADLTRHSIFMVKE